jgi:hypothetical protein
MRTYIGLPERHTAPWSETVIDIVGWDERELDELAAVLTYRNMFFILEQRDGKFWTILERTEIVGTLEECEIPLNEFVELSGYPELEDLRA